MPMQPCERCDILKRIGPMNRRVEVQEVTEVQDETGQPVEVWVTIRNWRANRKDVRGWERVRSDQELAERETVFTGRWFSGLTAKHRLWHDDMVWDIEGLAELGRRVALEVTATGSARLMPTAEAALYSILTSGSPNPVAAIVGSRVYPDTLPQNPTLPSIRYQRISTPRSQYRTLDGRAGYAAPRFQIDCYDLSRTAALTLAQAVYGLLEGFTGTVAGLQVDFISSEDERGDFEPDAGPDGKDLYREGLDVFIAHPET